MHFRKMEYKKNNSRIWKDFLHSPFRYNGHQTYSLGTIISFLPKHDAFVDPFCGGAGVFFSKPKVKLNWLNDINKELIETYRVIRDKPKELISIVQNENNSEERYNYFNNEFKPKDSSEVAARWFYLNRTSRFETMDKFWERDPSIYLDSNKLTDIISNCSKKLQGVQLTCSDFESIIAEAPANALLVMSPPYSLHHLQAKTQAYRYPFGRADHVRLADTLKQNSSRIKFLLIYRDCDSVRELYSWGNNSLKKLKCDNIFVNDITKKPEDQIKGNENYKEEIAIMNYEV